MKFEFTNYRNAPKNENLNLRISKELDSLIDKFAKRLELSRADTVRLILFDTIKKFTYTGKDELYCPYWDQMSEVLRIIKDNKMKSELEDLKDPDKISGIIEKYK